MQRISNKWRVGNGTVLLYCIALMIILSGATVYHYTIPVVLSSGMSKVLLYVFCILYILSHKRIPKKGLLLFTVFGTYLLCYILLSGHRPESKMSFFVHIFVPFLIYPVFLCQLANEGQVKALVMAFSNLMLLLAGLSVFFWFFGTILDVLPFKREIVYTWNIRPTTIKTYFGIHFETQTAVSTLMEFLGNTPIKRNVGIFCEAPSYALYLDFAVMIELLINKRVNKKRLAVLLLAVITTFSTKAYLILMTGLFMYVVLFSANKNRSQIAFLFMCCVILMFVVFIAGFILIQDKLQTQSGLTRLEDVRAGLITISRQPIFGVGLYDNEKILSYGGLKRSILGLSMGTSFIASTGLYIFVLYMGSLCLAWKRHLLDRKSMILFTILILMEFFISFVGEMQIMVMTVNLGYACAAMNCKYSKADERGNSIYNAGGKRISVLMRNQDRKSLARQ